MTTAVQKLDLIRWITSLTDEVVVQEVVERLAPIMERVAVKQPEPLVEFKTYRQIKENVFDFEALKREQNVKPISKEKLNRIVREADIREPIEVLLASID